MNASIEPIPTAPCVHVLAVDDEPLIRQTLSDYLGEHEIRVTTLADGHDVESVIELHSIDLLILDLNLPGTDGMRVMQRVRQQMDVPIIMLSGHKDEADRVMGLELGADDYVTKPFSPRELLARIRALMRRTRSGDTVADELSRIRAYRFGGWELNVRLRRLTTPRGETTSCTNTEFGLLVAFLTAPNRVLSRTQLLDRSRLHNDDVYERSIDVQIGRLRKRLGHLASGSDSGRPLIRTERGAGYLFDAAVQVVR